MVVGATTAVVLDVAVHWVGMSMSDGFKAETAVHHFAVLSSVISPASMHNSM